VICRGSARLLWSGSEQNSRRESIPHQYIANPAGANDVFFAIQAAQVAFPELSKHFVTMGHSQVGSIAWATAERQHQRPVRGYLGTVAGNPITNITAQMLSSPSSVVVVKPIIQALQSIFPTFSPGDILTERGIQLYSFSEELGACNSVQFQLFANPEEWLRPDWMDSWYIPAYVNLTAAGGHSIAGPMLVLQGTNDPAVNHTVTSAVVENKCTLFPEGQIEYAMVEGASHVPALFASQQIWLEWITDRFSGVHATEGCSRMGLSSLRPVGTYQAELTYYLQIALEPYVAA
jgi:pimeloyl-ACP methyl ester carboxylesterase